MTVEYYADETGFHPTITFEGEAQYVETTRRLNLNDQLDSERNLPANQLRNTQRLVTEQQPFPAIGNNVGSTLGQSEQGVNLNDFQTTLTDPSVGSQGLSLSNALPSNEFTFTQSSELPSSIEVAGDVNILSNEIGSEQVTTGQNLLSQTNVGVRLPNPPQNFLSQTPIQNPQLQFETDNFIQEVTGLNSNRQTQAFPAVSISGTQQFSNIGQTPADRQAGGIGTQRLSQQNFRGPIQQQTQQQLGIPQTQLQSLNAGAPQYASSQSNTARTNGQASERTQFQTNSIEEQQPQFQTVDLTVSRNDGSQNLNELYQAPEERFANQIQAGVRRPLSQSEEQFLVQQFADGERISNQAQLTQQEQVQGTRLQQLQQNLQQSSLQQDISLESRVPFGSRIQTVPQQSNVNRESYSNNDGRNQNSFGQVAINQLEQNLLNIDRTSNQEYQASEEINQQTFGNNLDHRVQNLVGQQDQTLNVNQGGIISQQQQRQQQAQQQILNNQQYTTGQQNIRSEQGSNIGGQRLQTGQFFPQSPEQVGQSPTIVKLQSQGSLTLDQSHSNAIGGTRLQQQYNSNTAPQQINSISLNQQRTNNYNQQSSNTINAAQQQIDHEIPTSIEQLSQVQQNQQFNQVQSGFNGGLTLQGNQQSTRLQNDFISGVRPQANTLIAQSGEDYSLPQANLNSQSAGNDLTRTIPDRPSGLYSAPA